ncbi:hypothetical protein [Herbaspirillum sp. ST 5-3]|uniref:hypothetical protein n=1 Tax=Oxalobacteraceae TaxID=75682 RepID=UPI0010A4493E|nr:hypothetical protein [Herbaspirillum sp. ST 5-3]
MLIWLKHPDHGVKDCYSESEAAMCEANGWIRFDPAAKADDKKMPEADIPVAAPVVERKKPGPKPKNRE